MYNKFPEDCSKHFRRYFQYFADQKKYIEGKKYFIQFKNILPIVEFHPFKGYILYFSYMSKDYSEIEEILNELIMNTKFSSQFDSLDFSLYAFYKGEILLNRKEFILASLSFGCCSYHILKNKESYMDQFQCESVKRLCLLKDLLPQSIGNSIDSILLKFQKIKGYKDLIYFFEYYNKKDKNFKSLEEFIENHKNDLKKNNLFGFAKIVLKELRFKFIQNILKKYNRVNMNKLVQLSGIEYPIVKNILEWKVCNNEIKIKFDEIENIIEVIDVEIGYCTKELKQYYQYLNQASNELYIYDKNKLEYYQTINSLPEDEKQKIIQSKKKRMDEMYEDDD
jgi:hypothetical protein